MARPGRPKGLNKGQSGQRRGGGRGHGTNDVTTTNYTTPQTNNFGFYYVVFFFQHMNLYHPITLSDTAHGIGIQLAGLSPAPGTDPTPPPTGACAWPMASGVDSSVTHAAAPICDRRRQGTVNARGSTSAYAPTRQQTSRAQSAACVLSPSGHGRQRSSVCPCPRWRKMHDTHTVAPPPLKVPTPRR